MRCRSPRFDLQSHRAAGLDNVSFLRQVADAREISRQTRLLLVPSVVEEGGPRVVREAQLSGIPVLGSPRGNVPDMLGEGGDVIEDYKNPRGVGRGHSIAAGESRAVPTTVTKRMEKRQAHGADDQRNPRRIQSGLRAR